MSGILQISVIVGVEKLQEHSLLVINLDFPLFTVNRIYNLYYTLKDFNSLWKAFRKALFFLGSRLLFFSRFLPRAGFVSFLWLICFVSLRSMSSSYSWYPVPLRRWLIKSISIFPGLKYILTNVPWRKLKIFRFIVEGNKPFELTSDYFQV